MSLAFFGLDIATRALQAQQTLVDISNQNIANANTPGYSRQTGSVAATPAYPVPVFSASGAPGQLGTGVTVSQITRARDNFIGGQIRDQLTAKGHSDAISSALSNVESIINEPSTTGLSSQITKYFSAWQNVANSPSDSSARAALVEQGTALAGAFNNTVGRLNAQQTDLNRQVSLTVTNINDYASQIATLNRQIAQVTTSGMQPNDLQDQRDQLLDKLSSLVKINTVQNPNGEISVYVNNHQLVDRSQTQQMNAVQSVSGPNLQPQWADGTPVVPGGGHLQGQLDARDKELAGQITAVDNIAARLISSVNSLHVSGIDLNGKPGVPFFSGTDASSISVNSLLTGPNGTDYVAAARAYQSGGTSTWAAGDASNAIALGNLGNALTTVGTTSQLQTGGTVASAPPMSVTGVAVDGATSGTTYAFSWDTTNNTLQVATSPGGTPTDVTASMMSSGSGNVVTVAGLGVRLTLSGSSAATLNSTLTGLVGQSVTTGAVASTIGTQYSQFVAQLGVDSTTAQGTSQNQAVLLTHLQQQEEQTSGVSLDEEATNLIQYQRAYQAAARVISTMDSMLDTLINHTGAA